MEKESDGSSTSQVAAAVIFITVCQSLVGAIVPQLKRAVQDQLGRWWGRRSPREKFCLCAMCAATMLGLVAFAHEEVCKHKIAGLPLATICVQRGPETRSGRDGVMGRCCGPGRDSRRSGLWAGCRWRISIRWGRSIASNT